MGPSFLPNVYLCVCVCVCTCAVNDLCGRLIFHIGRQPLLAVSRIGGVDRGHRSLGHRANDMVHLLQNTGYHINW